VKFRTKTILGIGLIETILLIILVISSIGFLNRSNDEQIQRHATTIAALFAATTKDAVLSTDLDSLQSFVDELLKNRDIVYVRILGNETVLAKGGDAQVLEKAFSADKSLHTTSDSIFDTSAVIEESGYQFGRVELGLSVAATTRLIAEAWTWASGIATLEILLVAFFSYILGTYLTYQLKKLSVAADSISSSGPGYQIEVKGNDEIAQVSQAFNQMSRNLSESYQQLNSSAKEFRILAERLTESDAKKSSMLLSALDAIITIDSNGLIEEFNGAAEKIFGYSMQEVIGKPMDTLIIPEQFRDAHRQGMQHWKETGEGPFLGQRMETTALRKTGETFPIELSISPVKLNGETIFTGFMRDITRQKEAELELRVAASAFDAQEGIFITDRDAKVIRVNNAFSQITGFSERDAIGSRPAELFKSGKHDQAFYKEMWGQLLKNGRWVGEIYNQRKNGEIYPQWLGISAIRDSDGQISNYIAHFIDISQRKKFEEELVNSRKKAESANIAKSQFLAAMSHEIRTPLNGVIGMTDLLLKTELQPKQMHMLRTASQSAQILLDIIRNILDFSKIESGELALESIPACISSIVEETCQILSPFASQNKVKMTLFIDPQIPQNVLTDPLRLRQILFNLSSNAIKFTRTDATREGRFILKLEAITGSGDSNIKRIRFSFEDNGIGIKKEKLDDIFEPFMQAELSTTRQFGGSGLGLAITRRIVEAMHGQIKVESLFGTGTRFIVELPLLTNELAAVTPSQCLTGTRIMVLEGLSPLDQYMLEHLRLLDAQVTLFGDSNQASENAIQAVQDGTPYHVIVMGAAWSQAEQQKWIAGVKSTLAGACPPFILLGDTLSQAVRDKPGIVYLNAFPLLPSELVSQVLAAVQAETPQQIDSNEPIQQASILKYSETRILLVEDNEINQDVIQLQLKQIGCLSDVARDGVEALEMYLKQDYNLILTDCYMPNKDGYELTREIRSMPGQKAKIPIIGISANSAGYEDYHWRETGMDEYLVKPLDVDNLKAVISRYILLRKSNISKQAVPATFASAVLPTPEFVDFDAAALGKVVGSSDLAVHEKLFGKFLQLTTKTIALVVRAAEQKDYVTVQREAHKLKSSAKAIGATRLSETCGLLEEGCKNNEASLVQVYVDNLKQDFIRVSEYLMNRS